MRQTCLHINMAYTKNNYLLACLFMNVFEPISNTFTGYSITSILHTSEGICAYVMHQLSYLNVSGSLSYIRKHFKMKK